MRLKRQEIGYMIKLIVANKKPLKKKAAKKTIMRISSRDDD